LTLSIALAMVALMRREHPLTASSQPTRRATWAACAASALSLGAACGAEAPANPNAAAAGVASPPFERLNEPRRFSGVVREVLAAGSYGYVRVESDTGDRWVATLGSRSVVGSAVDVTVFGARDTFHSRRLDRWFSPLGFGVVRAADPADQAPRTALETAR
jgi:hypothetical protein